MTRGCDVATIAVTVAAALGLTVCDGATPPKPLESPSAKNVILLIGDGFGPAEIALGLSYALEVEGRELAIHGLMKKGMTGYTLNMTAESMVTG